MNFSSKSRFHKLGNDENCVEQCPCKGIIMTSSIFTASEQNDIGAVYSRVEKDPGIINKKDDFGYTPLHFAAQHNNVKIVQLLIDKDADVNASDCGATPLHRAGMMNSLFLVLLGYLYFYCLRPFFIAYAGSFDSCKLLLDAGADPNCIDTSFMDQRTALHKAAANGCQEVVDLLVAYGGDSTMKDRKGMTVADVLELYHTRQQKNQQPLSTQLLSDQPPPDDKSNASISVTTPDTKELPGDGNEYSDGASTSVLDVPKETSSSDTSSSDMSMGISCPVCGNTSLLFTRYLRGGLVCLNCYSKR